MENSHRGSQSTDMLGSVRTITDASGAVKECYDYLPFGRLQIKHWRKLQQLMLMEIKMQRRPLNWRNKHM